MAEIYSITEAFSMDPNTYRVGGIYNRGKCEESNYPIIDRMETGMDGMNQNHCVFGYDKDNSVLFKYLINSVNISYYRKDKI